MADIPSFKAFVINFTSSSLVSVLNKQQFITETREFALSCFLLSVYCLYLWAFEFALLGRRMGVDWRFPNLLELVGLGTNVAWLYYSAVWVYMWFIGELLFTPERFGSCIIFSTYAAHIIAQHSDTVREEASRLWENSSFILKHPIIAFRERVDAKHDVDKQNKEEENKTGEGAGLSPRLNEAEEGTTST